MSPGSVVHTVGKNHGYSYRQLNCKKRRLLTQLRTKLCLRSDSVLFDVWLVELSAEVALDTLSDDV